jgi:hypothetical protein
MSNREANLRIASKLIGEGKISRRDFVSLAIASGVGIAVANTLFATAAHATIGGTFRVGLSDGWTTDSLDPVSWDNTFTADIGRGLIGNNLVTVNSESPFGNSDQ